MEHETPRTPKGDIMGSVLMVVGGLLLFRNITGVGLGEIWPLFIILFGLTFLVTFAMDRTQWPLLMPGSVLLAAGLVFLACVAWGWHLIGVLWPALVVAPGLGFLAMYVVGSGGGMALLAGTGLVVLGAVAMLRQSAFWKYWPVVLIGGGLALLARSVRKRP